MADIWRLAVALVRIVFLRPFVGPWRTAYRCLGCKALLTIWETDDFCPRCAHVEPGSLLFFTKVAVRSVRRRRGDHIELEEKSK